MSNTTSAPATATETVILSNVATAPESTPPPAEKKAAPKHWSERAAGKASPELGRLLALAKSAPVPLGARKLNGKDAPASIVSGVALVGLTEKEQARALALHRFVSDLAKLERTAKTLNLI